MKPLAAFDGWWFAPAPARRLALLRILTGGFALGYLLLRLPGLTGIADLEDSQFVPTGPVALISEPLPRELVVGIALVTVLVGVPFVVGIAYRFTAPVFALGFLWVTSYRNSWGMLFHTENLLSLHLVLLAASPAADAYSWDARRRTRSTPDAGAYGWPARAMSAATAVCYVLAGLAKLKLAGPVWLEGDLLRAQIAYDNLRKIELGSSYSLLGAALVRYRAPFFGLAILTVALELGAPIALVGRRVARVWVLGAWLFHLGVAAVMAIPFPYQLSLIAYASFFQVELGADFFRDRWRRLARTPPGTTASDT